MSIPLGYEATLVTEFTVPCRVRWYHWILLWRGLRRLLRMRAAAKLYGIDAGTHDLSVCAACKVAPDGTIASYEILEINIVGEVNDRPNGTSSS